MQSYQITLDELQKELCANSASSNEKEMSYVDELASCRETIKYLEDELDYLKSKASSDQNSLEQVNNNTIPNDLKLKLRKFYLFSDKL
jgi:hypothetical protein